MADLYNINLNEDEEINNNQKDEDKSHSINIVNEFENNNKLVSNDKKNNEEEKQEINVIQQENEIEILKEKIKSNSYQNNEGEYKSKIEKENLENNLNSYRISNKSKDQKILDLLDIINQYESQISSLNEKIISLTNNNKKMKDIIKTMEFGYEQTKINLITEKEVNKNNNTYMNNLYQDKILSEERIKELINIINQYSLQIDSLTNTLNIIKEENINYKKENDEYKINIYKLTEKINSLEYENKSLQNDNIKIYEEFSKLKEDNKKLCDLQYNTENKLKNIIDENEKMKSLIENEDNKNFSLIQAINQDLQSLAKYFNTKYNNFFNEEMNVNNLNNFNIDDDNNKLSLICFQNCEENKNNNKDINIEILIKTLINGFNTSKDKIKELIIQKNNLNEKLISYENKEKDYKEQIEKLKEDIFNNEKLINQFNSEIIELKKEINENDRSININTDNNCLALEKKIEVLNNEIKLKEVQIENVNKLIKIKDDNLTKLKEDNRKLIQDNVSLIKELKKYNKKLK